MTDLDDLTSVYSSQVHAVRTQITKFGEAYWDSMPNYRASAVEEMIDALVPRVTAGQLRIADLTRAYLARCAHELGWKLVVPPLDKADILGARGVDPRTVYRRPAVDLYKARITDVCSRAARTAASASSHRRSATTRKICSRSIRDATATFSRYRPEQQASRSSTRTAWSRSTRSLPNGSAKPTEEAERPTTGS